MAAKDLVRKNEKKDKKISNTKNGYIFNLKL